MQPRFTLKGLWFVEIIWKPQSQSLGIIGFVGFIRFRVQGLGFRLRARASSFEVALPKISPQAEVPMDATNSMPAAEGFFPKL